jgi:hypothetical protein
MGFGASTSAIRNRACTNFGRASKNPHKEVDDTALNFAVEFTLAKSERVKEELGVEHFCIESGKVKRLTQVPRNLR